MMINKENQRRKMEDSKKESRTQTKKDRRRKRKFRMFKDIQRECKTTKEGGEENDGIEVCTIYLCWGDILKTPK